MEVKMLHRLINIVGFALFYMLSSNTYSWTINSNFESKSLGQTAVGTDAFSQASQGLINNEIDAFSGDQVAKLPIEAGDAGFGRWGGIFDFPSNLKKGDEIWVKVSIWFPEGFFYNANPWLKFIRVKTPSGYNDWYIANKGSANPFQFIYEGEQVWSRFGTQSDAIRYNVWETYEMYLKLDNVSTTNGGEALVRVWKNGLLLGEFRDRRTLGNADQEANAVYLFTYWNGENSPSQHLYVDDIVITNETPAQRDKQGNPLIGENSPRGPLPPVGPTIIR
jgi:hypothetical protein